MAFTLRGGQWGCQSGAAMAGGTVAVFRQNLCAIIFISLRYWNNKYMYCDEED